MKDKRKIYISRKKAKIFGEIRLYNIIMEYLKTINLLDNTPNQLSNFRTKNWMDMNKSRGDYNATSDIRFKYTMLKSILCDYSDAYILVKGIITIIEEGGDAASRQADERSKGVIFKNCYPFTNCKSEITNTETDNAKGIDIAMSMHN